MGTRTEIYPNLRRTRRISWAPSGWLVSGTTTGVDTDVVTLSCADDFVSIRVGFVNINPVPYPITKVVAVASSTFSDHVNPTGNAVWKTLTFAAKGAAVDAIVAEGDAPTAITVHGNRLSPTNGNIVVPSWTWTDWTPLTSLPRTDVADAPRVLMIRVLLPKGCRHTRPNGGFLEYHLQDTINRGFGYVAGHVPADFVTSINKIDAATACLGQSNPPVACVQLLTKNEGIVGMTTGDSHHQGTSTTTQFLNYLLRVTTDLGSRHVGRIPFGYWTTAQGGADSRLFFPALENVLPVARPSFVVLPGWTYNEKNKDTHADQLATDIFFARLLMAAETCVGNGAVPIFLTPFPRDVGGMTPTQVIPWRNLRSSILALKDIGALVLDAAPLLGRQAGGLLDGTYLPEYSDDHAHPNDAGHSALAMALAPMIERLCGLSPV